MTASQIPFEPGAFTAPVADYEPPPVDVAARGRAASCPAPSSAAPHRSPRRMLRPAGRATAEARPHRTASAVAPPPAASAVAPPPAASAVAPPPAAATFADAALRRVLEVIDRRRPIAQLRPMLTPPLMDMVYTLTRAAGTDKAAVLRRVRLRTAEVVEPGRQPIAAEVFATYTRGQRVRAIAGRIEVREGRWRIVALQVG